jgi:hypothetical protein
VTCKDSGETRGTFTHSRPRREVTNSLILGIFYPKINRKITLAETKYPAETLFLNRFGLKYLSTHLIRREAAGIRLWKNVTFLQQFTGASKRPLNQPMPL